MPNEYREDIDLLILPGGPDLDPSQTTHLSAYHGQVAPEWLEFQANVLPMYINSGTKIFGICLGFQMLTAHFGGTLFGHIPEHNVRHLVVVENALPSNWATKLGVDEPIQYVSSRHHQAIHTYPEFLLPVAWSVHGEKKDWKKLPTDDDRGLLEAWIHASAPIMGVQWHPESIAHKPESYYARKYGYCIGDIIANAIMDYLINLPI